MDAVVGTGGASHSGGALSSSIGGRRGWGRRVKKGKLRRTLGTEKPQ